jgi:hypothetical protein
MLKFVDQLLLANLHIRGVAILMLIRVLNSLKELLFLCDSASYRLFCL